MSLLIGCINSLTTTGVERQSSSVIRPGRTPTGQLHCITCSCVDSTDISGMRPEEILAQVPAPVLGLSALGFPLVSSSPVLCP